jgi:hypothetical protein
MIILITIGISYFYFTITGYIEGDKISRDLLILGAITFGMSISLFYKKFTIIDIDHKIARKICLICTIFLGIVSTYMIAISEYSFSRFVDNRFIIPGFGLISSLFTITAVLGFSIIWKFEGFILKSTYLFFVLFVGITVGGKGFFLPIMFGFSLAGLVGIRRDISLVYAILLLPIIIAALYLSFLYSDSGGIGALNILNNRIFYAADAVVWVNKLSLFDIEFFPITAGTFVADIFLRFVDLRINPRSLGAEIVFLVYGEDGGAGPNANLPILAYLVNQGKMLSSIFFIVTAMLLLTMLRNFSFVRLQIAGSAQIFFAVAIFMMPSAIIDLVLYLQMVFWLMVIYAMCVVSDVTP